MFSFNYQSFVKIISGSVNQIEPAAAGMTMEGNTVKWMGSTKGVLLLMMLSFVAAVSLTLMIFYVNDQNQDIKYLQQQLNNRDLGYVCSLIISHNLSVHD